MRFFKIKVIPVNDCLDQKVYLEKGSVCHDGLSDSNIIKAAE